MLDLHELLTFYVVPLQTDGFVARDVKGPHQRVFVRGMSQTQRMAQLVGEYVGETSPVPHTCIDGRKEGGTEGRKVGRKEGRKVGQKEGRKGGRKEGMGEDVY